MIGLVHPGAMGGAVGRVLVGRGHEVGWASDGRSDATRGRAAGFTDLRSLDRLAAACDVILSICPPHAAVEVASALAGFQGLYVDANAVSPATAGRISETVGDRFVDGGIVGPPPSRAGTTRLYLSGPRAADVAALFAGSELDPRIVPDASALKMTYAAWTKGTTALLVAVRETARSFGVEDELLTEWALSLPGLPTRSQQAARTGAERGWRWAFELEEVGRTFAAAGQPDGFGAAAAEVFQRLAAGPGAPGPAGQLPAEPAAGDRS
jgi:3-hydroxyisobutyrate dehydrogenase-like beta-hydroxyacid dehydrogenase